MHKKLLPIPALLLLLMLDGRNIYAQPALIAPTAPYDIGHPILRELYVSPTGSDRNSGLTLNAPLKTLTAAWNKIPAGSNLTNTGYRINLLPGTYPCEPSDANNCLNYFSNRLGTYQYPIILRAYQGRGTVILRGGLDLRDANYLYLINLTLAGGSPLPTNASGNNLLHLASVKHMLLRGVTLDGPNCNNDSCNNLQETLKVNQAQYLYVENSTIGGAWHSAADYFAVQHGHFIKNRLHTAGQWCMYIKGGTSYLAIERNQLHACQLGFQAGQSSNLAMMRRPWLHYEAYDIKFINNVLHHLPGVGLSVSGGYNILFAYNTLYTVGTSITNGYPLLQTVVGERGCNATDELPNPVPACNNYIAAGGWGPNILTENLPAIPNRNVYIYNNLIYNPAPQQTLYSHFDVPPPINLPTGFQNLPSRVASDRNLVIKGNLIWNGPAGHPLGVDATTGCAPTNPTCNPSQLVQQNSINRIEPQLQDPGSRDFRPVPGGNVFDARTYAIPDFTWAVFTPPVPSGKLSNTVPADYDGLPRTGSSPPGAFVGP